MEEPPNPLSPLPVQGTHHPFPTKTVVGYLWKISSPRQTFQWFISLICATKSRHGPEGRYHRPSLPGPAKTTFKGPMISLLDLSVVLTWDEGKPFNRRKRDRRVGWREPSFHFDGPRSYPCIFNRAFQYSVLLLCQSSRELARAHQRSHRLDHCIYIVRCSYNGFISVVATSPPRGSQVMKVLLLTLSEHGQANSILALAAELGHRSDLDVHVGSFSLLEKRVDSIRSRSRSPVTFHTIHGTSYTDASSNAGLGWLALSHPPSNKSNRPQHMFSTALVPWTNEEYQHLVQEIEQIIISLDADAVVIDILFSPAVDACRSSGRRYLLNCPNQSLDLARLTQPNLRGLWYYPA